jgi:hypothetical protein
MPKQMPPVPPASQSPHGGQSDPKVKLGEKGSQPPDKFAEKGNQENLKQNTSSQRTHVKR